MAFLVAEEYLPATLTARPMTDDQFAAFCAAHSDLFFEMTAEGEIIVMPPTRSLTGTRNARILAQLSAWAEQDGRGTETGSSDGFVLPSGARRSPDAAWTANTRLAELSPQSLEGFWHLSPDFVIELKSDSDRLPTWRRKMQEWIANGTVLAWLINPDNQTVEIYRPGRDEAQMLTRAQEIHGEGPVAGFVLDMRRIWNPLPDKGN